MGVVQPARMLLVLALVALLVPRAEAYVPWNEQSDYRTTTFAGHALGDAVGSLTNASFYTPVALAGVAPNRLPANPNPNPNPHPNRNPNSEANPNPSAWRRCDTRSATC